MKLASLRRGGRDGALVVVSRDLARAVEAVGIAPTMQAALDDWARVAPQLEAISDKLNSGDLTSGVFTFDPGEAAAPLPRAFQFLDGSVYYHHMSVVRAARGAKMPEDYYETPLMYQGLSDPMLGATEALRLREDEPLGIDIEGEIVVITDDVPMGTKAEDASKHVKLIALLNDYSLRGVIPPELARGFGFLQGKCASSMSPVAVTPDELGSGWNGKLVSGRYVIHINGKKFGDLLPGIDATFDYTQLIAHATRTRELRAGTIVGAGALANADHDRHGSGCIAEERAHEQVKSGAPVTPYLRFGDSVRLEMFNDAGQSIFGAIDQAVERYPG